MFGGPMKPMFPTMQRIADTMAPSSEALVERRTEEEKVQAAPSSSTWVQLRDVIREEMSAALSVSQSAAARPMQFIINNSAQANVEQAAPAPAPVPPPPPQKPSTLVEAFFRFMESPLNRIFVYGMVGIGLYVIQGHLAHTWRLEEMKRRIDANPMLRLKAFLSKR